MYVLCMLYVICYMYVWKYSCNVCTVHVVSHLLYVVQAMFVRYAV